MCSGKEGLRLSLLYPLAIFIISFSYQQAQSSASIGRRKLEELGIQTTRPDDYFAEMVKTDDHMRKVQPQLTLGSATSSGIWYLFIA